MFGVFRGRSFSGFAFWDETVLTLSMPGTPNNIKQPFIIGCFNWMIPNHYTKNGCFTKHPFINGCLGFQVKLVSYIYSPLRELAAVIHLFWNTATERNVRWNISPFFLSERLFETLTCLSKFTRTVEHSLVVHLSPGFVFFKNAEKSNSEIPPRFNNPTDPYTHNALAKQFFFEAEVGSWNTFEALTLGDFVFLMKYGPDLVAWVFAEVYPFFRFFLLGWTFFLTWKRAGCWVSLLAGWQVKLLNLAPLNG